MTLDDLKARDPVAALAIPRTEQLEGGLVDNRADPGGVTNRGISLAFALAEIKAHPTEIAILDIDHDGRVDALDIAGLTTDEATTIYYETVWLRYGYGRLQPADVAWKAFDICVNTGPKRSALILQEALGYVGHPVAVDGDLGPGTVAAVLACQNAPLLSAMRIRQATFYKSLVAANPKLATFAKGWAARAAA